MVRAQFDLFGQIDLKPALGKPVLKFCNLSLSKMAPIRKYCKGSSSYPLIYVSFSFQYLRWFDPTLFLNNCCKEVVTVYHFYFSNLLIV